MTLLANTTTGIISTLDILSQINFFRAQEGRKSSMAHGDLLKIVRNEFEEEINAGKISLVHYLDGKGENRPMYALNFNQAKQILLRESSTVRRAVIEYIDRLEQELRMATRDSYMIEDPVERALRWADEKRHSMELEHKVDILTHTDTTYTATELAVEVGFKSAQKFNRWLADCGFQRKVNGTWIPYAKFADDGYVDIKQEIIKGNETYHRKFTQKGREYILELAIECSGAMKI
ncbi:MAG: phage antirepressor KilAC domain-containing protein [Cellulosilyticaceae bacterium]